MRTSKYLTDEKLKDQTAKVLETAEKLYTKLHDLFQDMQSKNRTDTERNPLLRFSINRVETAWRLVGLAMNELSEIELGADRK